MKPQIDEGRLIQILSVIADDAPKGIDILKDFISATAIEYAMAVVDHAEQTIKP